MAHKAHLTAALLLLFIAAFCGSAAAQDVPDVLTPFVYGIVLEQTAEPGEEGVNVTMQWTDEYGVVWEARVRTVTAEEMALGGQDVLTPDSPVMQGDSIILKGKGLTIELSAKSPTESISNKLNVTAPIGTPGTPGTGGTSGGTPGDTTEGPRESHTFGDDDDTPEEGIPGETTGNVPEGGTTTPGEGGETPGEGEEQKRSIGTILKPITDNAGLIALGILGVLLLAGGGIAYLELKNRKKGPQVDPGSLRITRLMKKETQTVTKEDTVEKVIHLIVTEDLTSVPVLKGKEVVGLVTLQDLLVHSEDTDLMNKQVKDVMSQAKGVSADSTLMEAIETFLTSDLDEMPVLQKKNLVGVTTLRHLLEQLDMFFASTEFKSGLPTLNELMKVHASAKPNKKVKELVKVLIAKGGPIEVHEVGAVLGIITEREIVQELYHGQSMLAKVPAERVMSKHQFILDARRDIIGANSLMLDHTSYWTRIMKQDKIVGIVTSRELFEGLAGLLKEYRGGKR